MNSKSKRNLNIWRCVKDNIRLSDICVIAFSKKREKGEENFFEELLVENFPNLEKEADIQIQEAQSSK